MEGFSEEKMLQECWEQLKDFKSLQTILKEHFRNIYHPSYWKNKMNYPGLISERWALKLCIFSKILMDSQYLVALGSWISKWMLPLHHPLIPFPTTPYHVSFSQRDFNYHFIIITHFKLRRLNISIGTNITVSDSFDKESSSGIL